MKCALAGVGFINEDIEYNKAVLADTLRKCAGRADVVIFEEAFLQGFYGINFIAKHDTTVSISRDDMIIREICSMAKEYAIAVSFGFIEKEDDVFFSSQMTIDKNGQIIDLYRRVSPGWKESFAGKEYCEGDGFHTFHLLGREVAIGLCGDLYPRLRRAVHCGLHLGRLYLHRRRHYVTVNNIWECHIFPFLAKSLPSRGLFVHFLGRFCNSHRFARISPPGRKIPPFRGYYGG